MDLFLETPQQKADRILRQQQRLLEMQAQAAANPYGSAQGGRGDLFAGGDASDMGGYPPAEPFPGGSTDGGGIADRGGLFGRRRPADNAARESRPEDYSVQQDEYRRELDYDRRRSKRRTLRARLRTLATIVLVPLGLVAIFLVSYSLTCILNGATPNEVVQHLTNLVQRLAAAIETAFPPS